MDEYTPTTKDVKEAYRWETDSIGEAHINSDNDAEFDRWYTADRVALIQELAFSGYFGTNAQSNLLRIAEIVAKGGGVPKA